jgi:hypothetical protein
MDSLLESLQRGLGDSVRLERELGGGGMSRVFLARDLSLDRPIVIKVLSAEASEGISADRFRREIQLIARLRHPLIVPIIAASEIDGFLYYTMPFIAGDSLRGRLKRDGALPVGETVRVLRDVLDALGFAHANGVVHRDIKPENILLESGHSLLGDFGVAKALGESATLTSTGVSIGTPAYMAPEQVAGDATLDHRADVYAVGVVGYEMLTGAAPFVGTAAQVVASHLTRDVTPIAQRRPELPTELAQLVMRALEKDPAKRHQSAAEMLGALDRVPIVQSTVPTPSMRRRAGVALAAIAALALMAFVGWRITRPPVAASARSIAIVPLSVVDGDTALVRLSQNLVTLVSNNLDGVGEIRVADPISVLSHARSVGHEVATADAMNIARALRAKSAAYGTLLRNGASVRIDVGLYDVATPNAPMARVSVSAPPDSVELLSDSLTMGLLRQIWSRGAPPTPHVASITSHSPIAVREFLEGERRFMHGAVHEAGDSYRRAVAADTTFWFAAYRYGLARNWLNQPVEDTAIIERLKRHRAELPERERALLAVADSSPTRSEYVRRLNSLTVRYPDYAPGWERLADELVHRSGYTGRSVAESIEPWRHVAALMPGDLTTADHLVYACMSAGELRCARQAYAHFDSLVRSDPAAANSEVTEQRLLLLALEPATRARRDSIFAASTRDSAMQTAAPIVVVDYAAALIENPEFLPQLEAFTADVTRLPLDPITRRVFRVGDLLFRATRGDWESLDSADAQLAAGAIPFFSKSEAVRARVLAELQGLIPPAAATAAAAAATLNTARTTDERIGAIWQLATSAMLRGDSVDLRARLAALARDTTAEARIATRSLRAIGLGRVGKTAAAAESLLVLERQHGEYAPKVWSAFAADRLLAAQWLTELGKPAPADSLLEFTRAYVVGPELRSVWPVFGAAQLQRSRIAEAMGKRADAVFYATLFTRVYDLAPSDHRAQLEEARRRIERLGGALDAKRSRVLP